MRIKLTLSFLVFSACTASTTPSLQGPAVDALIALPPAQFAAALGLATEVSQGCTAYKFSPEIQDRIIEARRASGAPSVAGANAAGISIELDVATRSFQAKHDLVVGQDNTCTAIANEVADQSAISAVLIPV